MTKDEFSVKILKCSYGHWRYVLRGERNLSYNKARLVSQLLVTDVDTWLDTKQAKNRQAAWDKFNEARQ